MAAAIFAFRQKSGEDKTNQRGKRPKTERPPRQEMRMHLKARMKSL
jgi:hypothetical protein